ncbi:hypothetical protein [Lysinibacillus odysseyi]|uniref:hypothetical protein n=1 Tax=Lysinibacillus odysseyi TaxID=202611 RepID=UPI002ADDC73B|nr:hypothetical protein [Lysinibacillus odysseyi]
MVRIQLGERSVPSEQFSTAAHPAHLYTVAAVRTYFLAACTMIKDKLFLFFI